MRWSLLIGSNNKSHVTVGDICSFRVLGLIIWSLKIGLIDLEPHTSQQLYAKPYGLLVWYLLMVAKNNHQ